VKEIDADGDEGEVNREWMKLAKDAVANNVPANTTQVFRIASFDMDASISFSTLSPTSLENDFHTNPSTDAATPSPQWCCDECHRKFYEIQWENRTRHIKRQAPKMAGS
jgi:hypothetical protein